MPNQARLPSPALFTETTLMEYNTARSLLPDNAWNPRATRGVSAMHLRQRARDVVRALDYKACILSLLHCNDTKELRYFCEAFSRAYFDAPPWPRREFGVLQQPTAFMQYSCTNTQPRPAIQPLGTLVHLSSKWNARMPVLLRSILPSSTLGGHRDKKSPTGFL
jgi:hypothetical protein